VRQGELRSRIRRVTSLEITRDRVSEGGEWVDSQGPNPPGSSAGERLQCERPSAFGGQAGRTTCRQPLAVCGYETSLNRYSSVRKTEW